MVPAVLRQQTTPPHRTSPQPPKSNPTSNPNHSTAGFLADEGCYDRMNALLEKYHSCDVLLLLAAAANDTSKVKELIKCGADVKVGALQNA